MPGQPGWWAHPLQQPAGTESLADCLHRNPVMIQKIFSASFFQNPKHKPLQGMPSSLPTSPFQSLGQSCLKSLDHPLSHLSRRPVKMGVMNRGHADSPVPAGPSCQHLCTQTAAVILRPWPPEPFDTSLQQQHRSSSPKHFHGWEAGNIRKHFFTLRMMEQ